MGVTPTNVGFNFRASSEDAADVLNLVMKVLAEIYPQCDIIAKSTNI